MYNFDRYCLFEYYQVLATALLDGFGEVVWNFFPMHSCVKKLEQSQKLKKYHDFEKKKK